MTGPIAQGEQTLTQVVGSSLAQDVTQDPGIRSQWLPRRSSDGHRPSIEHLFDTGKGRPRERQPAAKSSGVGTGTPGR